MPRRRFPLPVALLIVACLLICSCGGCCATTLGAGAFPILMGQSPLIFWGQRADATITAIMPCASGVALSGNPGGFDFRIGESSATSSTIRVRSDDMRGQEHIGQTVACTTLDAPARVGDSLAVIVRPDVPQDILLDKDRGVYQTLAVVTWVGALLLLVIAILLVRTLYVTFLRQYPAYPTYPAAGGAASPGATPLPPETIARLAQEVIGPGNDATRQIRLKEALLLLHLRRSSSPMDDDSFVRRQSTQLRDHFVLAAILLELRLNGKIAIRSGGLAGRARHIEVLDPTPLGDPDTDDVLAELAATGGLHGGRLWRFYMWYGPRRHLTARLIDQLRRGGYVRLHVPTTGRFAQQRAVPANRLGQMVARWLTPFTLKAGVTVPTDDYTQALPWQYLDTTHTGAEERIFGRVQEAIAMRAVTDDFVRGLLILVAAHYLPVNPLSRRLSARYNLYRFYPPEEQRRLRAFLRQVADQSPESEHALFRLARDVDERLENPPSS